MWIDDLPEGALDSAAATPLHRQLSSALRASITASRAPAGSQLPTEAELQQKYGVSRSVVRQALLTLTIDGLINRGRGRGSVVAVQGEHHRLVQRISGLSSQMPRTRTEMLSLSHGRNAVAEAALAVTDVTQLRRLRSVDNEPIALIETWLPARFAAGLTAETLTDSSLHAVLTSKFGITIVSGRRAVRAVAASASMAAILRVAPGAPLLALEGTSFDQGGEPIEYFTTWHRADRVVFDLDVLQDSGAADSVTEGIRNPAVNPGQTGQTVQPAETRQDRIARLSGELSWLLGELETRDSLH